MLIAAKGIYENGQIFWEDAPPVKGRKKVVVTFLDEETSIKKPRKAGSLAGRGSLPSNFNEPLGDLSDYM